MNIKHWGCRNASEAEEDWFSSPTLTHLQIRKKNLEKVIFKRGKNNLASANLCSDTCQVSFLHPIRLLPSLHLKEEKLRNVTATKQCGVKKRSRRAFQAVWQGGVISHRGRLCPASRLCCNCFHRVSLIEAVCHSVLISECALCWWSSAWEGSVSPTLTSVGI